MSEIKAMRRGRAGLASHSGHCVSDHILGICRFSFLGRSDWHAYRGTRPNSPQQQAARQAVAATLYQPERLEFRFRTFQSLTLPSLAAQSDGDFGFLVLTSPQMPAEWLARLHDICASVPQVRVAVSDQDDLGRALAPLLNEYPAGVQFRLDDDDCLCVDYIARLRRAARAMRAYPAFTFSLPKALALTHYGQGPQRLELQKPFHAAGAALRQGPGAPSIFAYGHYGLARRFIGITDPEPYGSLQLKFQGHDSQQVRPMPGNGIQSMTDEAFAAALKRHFPFVTEAGLLALRP